MKAILLAAGFGTRLRPLTDTIPKCLVPIKGKPLLEIWLETLSNVGIDNILINTHYLSNQVLYYILKSKYKNNCIIVNEKQLLGTAGTLLSNLNFIGSEECLLIHADNYCLANFTDFLKAHKNRPSNCFITMMTFRTDSPKSCGIVEVDDQNIVVGFHEKVENPPGNLANGAIYILSIEFLNILKTQYQNLSDFSTEILPLFINKIFCYETKNKFIDIGTISKYNEANNF
jgi:mannose-1-phosphate guanylyltransferase